MIKISDVLKMHVISFLLLIGVRFENVEAFIEKNNILRTALERGSDVYQGKRLSFSHGKQFKSRINNRPSRRIRKKSRSDTDGSDNYSSRKGLKPRRERPKKPSTSQRSAKTVSKESRPLKLKDEDKDFPKLQSRENKLRPKTDLDD